MEAELLHWQCALLIAPSAQELPQLQPASLVWDIVAFRKVLLLRLPADEQCYPGATSSNNQKGDRATLSLRGDLKKPVEHTVDS
jgi:hypothetical protein